MEDILFVASTASFVLAAVFMVCGVVLFFKLGTMDAIRFMQHKTVTGPGLQSRRRASTASRSGGSRGSRAAGGARGSSVTGGASKSRRRGAAPVRHVSSAGSSSGSSASVARGSASAWDGTSEDPTSLLGHGSEDPTSLLVGSSEDPTSLLVESSEEPTSLLVESSEDPTSLLVETSEEPTSILGAPVAAGSAVSAIETSEEPTSILEGNTPWQELITRPAAFQADARTPENAAAAAAVSDAQQNVAQHFEPGFRFNVIHNEVIVHTAAVIE